jgi:starch synthase
MRVGVSCHGKFHHFDLARELHMQGALERLFTGYPRWKLHLESLPLERVTTFPWLMVPAMASGRWGLHGLWDKTGSERTAAGTFAR